jgi:uncharacterized membrane protein
MSVQAQGAGTTPRTWAIIIWCLFLAAVIPVLGLLSVIVGVIIAYVKREDLAGTPYESHITSAIRTFWISLAGGLLSIVLMFVQLESF